MIKTFVQKALEEDIGRGDLFALVAESQEAKAVITCKDTGILAGAQYIEVLCDLEGLNLCLHVKDGDVLKKGQKIATLAGDSHTLLKCERTLLNMLQHASGIATKTYAFKQAAGTDEIKILDTRKTRPHLRVFEKYAVQCGGGTNHRLGLDDCLMLKDTHLKTIDDLSVFMQQARKKLPFTCKVEIECESLEQVNVAMKAGADIVMCDNMTPKEVQEVVAFRNENYPHILLEASGNISLETISAYAASGVDAVSSILRRICDGLGRR